MIVGISGREWTFDPDRADGGVLVDRVDADMPEYRVGKTYSLDFVFFQNTQDTTNIEYESGGTLGGAYQDVDGDVEPSGFTLGGSAQNTNGDTVASGGSVGSSRGDGTNIDRYRMVREYTRWAGRYVITEAIDGTPRISEHTPSDASVDSIIVKLVPGREVDATPGLWVVVDDVNDQTRYVKDTARISIRVTVLARGDQYGSRQALKDDIGSGL